jgi:hypothetical protein
MQRATHLQQTGQLVQVLYAGLRVHQPALVAEGRIAAHQHVAGNRLSEHVHAQHILRGACTCVCVYVLSVGGWVLQEAGGGGTGGGGFGMRDGRSAHSGFHSRTAQR